ncbi:MAG TPA: hypothetical protein VL361_26725 [Candidatus Limnocylindrales bacterium]|jgi:hypothetical protein|nr:hypothetical protein [Candidatus Limnocylindrales bacterium]
MARRVNNEIDRDCLSAQIEAEARAIRQKYGPEIGWDQLLRLLDDRNCVRFPCEIRFDAKPLLPGEFAHAEPNGAKSDEGFTIYVHPSYAERLPLVSYVVLHQLVLVNYGTSATADDAETFGSGALGLSKDQYYSMLCELSGQIGGDELL